MFLIIKFIIWTKMSAAPKASETHFSQTTNVKPGTDDSDITRMAKDGGVEKHQRRGASVEKS